MTNELKNRLDEIVGKTFSYENKNITINKYKDVSSANVVIFVEDRPFKNLLYSEVEHFLDQLFDPITKETSSPAIVVNKNEFEVFQPTKENETVKETLLETLKKVKEDPAFIPQAHAVCEVVQQIVNVQKTEIQMLNILKRQ